MRIYLNFRSDLRPYHHIFFSAPTHILQIPGLSKRAKPSTTTGFYDGKDFVLMESEWSALTIAKLLWRYGFDFIQLFREVDAWLKQFEK